MSILRLSHILLLSAASLLVLSAILLARLRGPEWLKRHKIFNAAGALSGFAGSLMISLDKGMDGLPHFQSFHGKLGLCVLLGLLAVPLAGHLLTKGRGALRIPHRLLGYLVLAAMWFNALTRIVSLL